MQRSVPAGVYPRLTITSVMSSAGALNASMSARIASHISRSERCFNLRSLVFQTVRKVAVVGMFGDTVGIEQQNVARAEQRPLVHHASPGGASRSTRSCASVWADVQPDRPGDALPAGDPPPGEADPRRQAVWNRSVRVAALDGDSAGKAAERADASNAAGLCYSGRLTALPAAYAALRHEVARATPILARAMRFRSVPAEAGSTERTGTAREGVQARRWERPRRPLSSTSWVLEHVQVDFEALSGAAPILFGLGSSAADVLVSAA